MERDLDASRRPVAAARLATLFLATVLCAALLAGATPAHAANTDAETNAATSREPSLPWYVPDYAKLQFAGNIGFLSAGVGYAYLDDILQTEAFFGVVPSFFGEEELYMATVKQTVVPYAHAWADEVTLVPFYAGVFANYSFGSEYYLDIPDYLDENYYTRQTALRYGPLIGGRISARLDTLEPLSHVGGYWELNANDLAIDAYLDNPEFFEVYDVVALGVGLRVGFE